MRKINHGFTTAVVIWRVYHGLFGLNLEDPLIKSDTVDGSEIPFPTTVWMYLSPCFQPVTFFPSQLVSRIFEPSTVSGQFITTSAEVTPNGGLVRESPPKMALN